MIYSASNTQRFVAGSSMNPIEYSSNTPPVLSPHGGGGGGGVGGDDGGEGGGGGDHELGAPARDEQRLPRASSEQQPHSGHA